MSNNTFHYKYNYVLSMTINSVIKLFITVFRFHHSTFQYVSQDIFQYTIKYPQMVQIYHCYFETGKLLFHYICTIKSIFHSIQLLGKHSFTIFQIRKSTQNNNYFICVMILHFKLCRNEILIRNINSNSLLVMNKLKNINPTIPFFMNLWPLKIKKYHSIPQIDFKFQYELTSQNKSFSKK